MNIGRDSRRMHTAARLGAVACCVCLSLTGCRYFAETQRPTIESLFEEAVTQAQTHPENTFLAEPQETPRRTGRQSREALPPPLNSAEESAPLAIAAESFQDTDIREALQILADTAKTSVVVDEKVRGVVNCTIENLSFEAALDKVLLPLNLVWVRRDNQYLVGIPEPDSALFWQLAEHHEFHPGHFQATDVLQVLPERMKKFVRVVEKANVLVIDAPHRQSEAILSRLEQIDQPVPQVILEALVCVMSPECEFKFGLDWQHAANVNGNDPFSIGVTNLGISGTFSRGGAAQAFDDFAVTSSFVRLMAQHGYLAIRASPRVTAKNGEKANISLNRETFFSPQTLTTSGQNSTSQNFIFQQNIQKVDTGIVLEIVPQIRGDEVTFQIDKAEVSEDVRASGVDTTNPYPVINRRSVSTTVHVRDGKTMVIGGLVQRQFVEQVSEVPGLSRLPVLGYAFKRIQRQERDAEVVILISPRIVTPAASKDRLPPNSFEP